MEALRDLLAEPVSPRRAIALALCAVGVGLVSAAAGIGGGAAPPATSIASRYEVRVVGAGDLERVPRSSAPLAAELSRKSAKLSYFTTVNFETVVPGGDELYEIRCPAKRQPLTGGVLAATPGLALSNSSRVSPDPDRPTLSGAWYEGVTNLTASSLQWKPLLVCVRS